MDAGEVAPQGDVGGQLVQFSADGETAGVGTGEGCRERPSGVGTTGFGTAKELSNSALSTVTEAPATVA